MAGPFDIEAHTARLRDVVALYGELIPEHYLEVSEIRANFHDARLCNDRDLMERTDREASLRMDYHERLASLLLVMSKAQVRECEPMSRTAYEMLMTAIRQEWDRRSGGGAQI